MRPNILGRVKTSSQKLTWAVWESNTKSHTTNLRQKPIISFSFTSMKTWNYEIPFQFLSIPVIGTPVTQPLKRAFTTWAGSTKLSIAGGNYNALREEVNVRLGHFQQREVYWGSHSQWDYQWVSDACSGLPSAMEQVWDFVLASMPLWTCIYFCCYKQVLPGVTSE